MNNLTANAVESIEQKGKIDIDVLEESAHTYFIIKDSGKGIPEEDVSIIFEPGYTTKFNDHGVAATGIGLSHVQEIIQTLRRTNSNRIITVKDNFSESKFQLKT